ASVLEETLFRGYLLQALLQLSYRFWLVNLGQSILFAAVHIPARVHQLSAMLSGGARDLLIRFLFGLTVGWLARRSGCLWPALACHVVTDVLVLYAEHMGSYGLFHAVVGG